MTPRFSAPQIPRHILLKYSATTRLCKGLCHRFNAKKGDAVMRFMLCILLVASPLSFAFAVKGTMSLSDAQAAAAKGDADAAAAIMMTTERQTCLNGCANRGYNKDQCTEACRPGLCHPGAQQPYCVAK
jgi:hypothetical protein